MSFLSHPMFDIFFYATVGLWLVYALAILSAMYFVRPNHPCHTGFRIVMPDHLKIQLTPAEYNAIYAHEEGHRVLRHAWLNYLRAILLFPAPRRVLESQEIAADAWAAKHGHAQNLASALMKLGADDAFDLYRVNILRKTGGMSGNQAFGVDVQQAGGVK